MEKMKSLNLNDLEHISGGTLTEEQITSFTIVAEFNKKIKFDDLCLMFGINDPEDVAYAQSLYDRIRSRQK